MPIDKTEEWECDRCGDIAITRVKPPSTYANQPTGWHSVSLGAKMGTTAVATILCQSCCEHIVEEVQAHRESIDAAVEDDE